MCFTVCFGGYHLSMCVCLWGGGGGSLGPLLRIFPIAATLLTDRFTSEILA